MLKAYCSGVLALSAMIVSLLAGGCASVQQPYQADREKLAKEGSTVFVRPGQYTIFFGSESLNEYLEITYERGSVNEAGQMVVELGLRNRGPVRWYNFLRTAPDQIVVMAQANFYETITQGHGPSGPPVYRTNRQKFVIKRGELVDCRFVCPVKTARSYQVVLSEEASAN